MAAITLPPIPSEPNARDVRIIPVAGDPRRLIFTGSGLSSAAAARVSRVQTAVTIHRANTSSGVSVTVEFAASRKAEVLAALTGDSRPVATKARDSRVAYDGEADRDRDSRGERPKPRQSRRYPSNHLLYDSEE